MGAETVDVTGAVEGAGAGAIAAASALGRELSRPPIAAGTVVEIECFVRCADILDVAGGGRTSTFVRLLLETAQGAEHEIGRTEVQAASTNRFFLNILFATLVTSTVPFCMYATREAAPRSSQRALATSQQHRLPLTASRWVVQSL